MALGTLGSTLNDELNRLANGGTYRDMDDMVDEALAAKQWANRENINPYSTDTVGILNEIAGLGLDKRNWLDFNGVCNYIAGTTGLPAAAALRQVYPTTDLLTSQASYYVDAIAPQNWWSLGYVTEAAASSSRLQVADSAELDITGDIDIRARVAFDDWTPGVTGEILSKWGASGNFAWYFRLTNSNKLEFVWSSNGTNSNTRTSTVDPTVTDGEALWVRVTLDVDNGASGNDTIFYTSTDGSTWTQLGTTVTGAGTTSIFASTGSILSNVATTTNAITKKSYYYQIRNGINGTAVLTIDVANDYKSTDSNTFTATTGQQVIVNGEAGAVRNLGTAGSLLPTTPGSSTVVDSNDPKFLDHTGTNYVYLPGVASNYLSVPDSDALDITGDIDIRCQVALDDWTPTVVSTLIAKEQTTTTRSYRLQVNSAGTLLLVWTTDGSTLITAQSTVATGVADGATKWVRATLDVDNGASGRDIKFYTSDDGTTWTQLGTTVTQAGTTSIYSGTSQVEIGSRVAGNTEVLASKVFRAQIYDGIDGTKVLDVNTSVITAGSATSFTAVTGQTVTINRSTSGRKTVAVTQPTWLFGTDDYMEVNNRYMASGTYLYLPGVASNFASAPDAAPLDITGDLDLRVKVALDDWTPSAAQAFVSKDNAGQRSYAFYINTTGTLALFWSANGTATAGNISSTVATGITDGSTKWVRVTLDVDNGAAGNDVKFFTSDDGTSWTQLGTTVTTAGTTSIYSGTATLNVGSQTNGTVNVARGKFFRAMIYADLTETTLAFDANFETSITSLLQTSFTESSTNAATVTINRSGSAYRSAGITAAGYLYPGATNTFSASATDFLNFGASDNFTLMAVHRQWDTAATGTLISNRSITGATIEPGYYLTVNTASGGVNRSFTAVGDQDESISTGGVAANGWVNGVLNTRTVTLNRSTNLLTLNQNTTIPGSINTITGLGNLTNNFIVRIGAQGGRDALTGYLPGEIMAVAIFRSALTNAQIRQISNYFANREVYL